MLHTVVPSCLAHSLIDNMFLYLQIPVQFTILPFCGMTFVGHTRLAMQAEHRITSWMCATSQVKASLYSRRGQTSATLSQLYSSSGTMQLMLTLAPLLSHQGLIKKLGGYVISAQMAMCTAGRHLSKHEQQAMVVLSAAAVKCASTIPWPPRLPGWRLSGTMKQTRAPLMM